MENGKTIRLSDGRMLGYAEHGRSSGRPLLYFHGHPGSRFEAEFLAEEAARIGVRLVGVDRPGMGLSSYKANRTIVDWPDDVVELADHLRIDHFAVVGFSGGGPYALACAYRLPDRLTACGIISGLGRTSLFLYFLSIWVPWLTLPVLRRFSLRDQEQAGKSLARASQRWVEPDRRALSVPGVAETLSASLADALRPGARGAARDGALIGSLDWGFKPSQVIFHKLYLWHGELDNQSPVHNVRALANALPEYRAVYYPDEGHISLIVNRGHEILSSMIQD